MPGSATPRAEAGGANCASRRVKRPAAAKPHHLVACLLEDPADEGVEERRQLVEARGVLRVVLTVRPAERLLEPGQCLRLAQRHLAQQGGDHLL